MTTEHLSQEHYTLGSDLTELYLVEDVGGFESEEKVVSPRTQLRNKLILGWAVSAFVITLILSILTPK